MVANSLVKVISGERSYILPGVKCLIRQMLMLEHWVKPILVTVQFGVCYLPSKRSHCFPTKQNHKFQVKQTAFKTFQWKVLTCHFVLLYTSQLIKMKKNWLLVNYIKLLKRESKYAKLSKSISLFSSTFSLGKNKDSFLVRLRKQTIPFKICKFNYHFLFGYLCFLESIFYFHSIISFASAKISF